MTGEREIHLLWGDGIKFEPRTTTWGILSFDTTRDSYLLYYSISRAKISRLTMWRFYLENFFRSGKKSFFFLQNIRCYIWKRIVLIFMLMQILFAIMLLEKLYVIKFWNSIWFVVKNCTTTFISWINYELMKCYRNKGIAREDVRCPVCSSRIIVYGNFLHVSRCKTWS